MAEPKCPECRVQGTDKIVSRDSAERSEAGDERFNVVYCSECGHVYGVFAKHVISYSPPF